MKIPRFPHPLLLLLGGVALGAALTHVVPAGRYERRMDPATGRSVVVAGTYHRVEPKPVGPFGACVAIPRGLGSAQDIVFFIFLIGGALTVVDKTGVLGAGVDALVRRMRGREGMVIPAFSLLFALGGVVEGAEEELIPLVPVLLVLGRRCGYDPLTVVAMSAGAALVGGAFGPANPFVVGIGQRLAELPLLSGTPLRMVFLAPALLLWIVATKRYAARHAVAREEPEAGPSLKLGWRFGAVLALVLAVFVVFVCGVVRWGWGFEEMGALFLAMGVAAGLLGGLGLEGTVAALIEGFRGMAFAGLIVGFARAIFVVLDDGRVVDSLVHGVFTPIASMPVALSAFGMMAVQAAAHVPVPSFTGQATLTMPVLIPISDLLGLSRQVTVLAFQYGAGVMEMVTPTNGALMAILAAAGVRFEDWLRFAAPLCLMLFGLGALAIAAGMLAGV